MRFTSIQFRRQDLHIQFMRRFLRELKNLKGVVKNMVVKSGKGNRITGILLVLGAIVFFYSDIEVLVGVIVLFTRLWMTMDRTLIMDEEGCTVSFLGFRKKYLWKNLRIKRIERYYYSNGAYNDYDDSRAIVFSVHRIHKPRWMQAYDYSFLIHPFSFFFVYCPSLHSDGKENKKRWYSLYEVNEREFLEQMKNWNVELEDTRRKSVG